MKSGKPKTKRYQFGGTLRSQISGTRNAPPPTRPAPAPAKPMPTGSMPPQVKAGAVSPVPPPPRSTIAPTPTLAKTTFSNPAVAGGVFDAFKKAGVSPAEVEGYTKAALQQGKSAGLGAMPATPTKTTGGPFNVPPEIVNIPDPRLKGAPPMPVFGPPGDYTPGAPKVVPAGSKPYVPPPEFAKQFAMMEQQRAARSAVPKVGMKKGGAVKAYAKGGKVSSASSRGDGIAQRGKTKGRMV